MQFTYHLPTSSKIRTYETTKRYKNKSYLLLCSILPYIEYNGNYKTK